MKAVFKSVIPIAICTYDVIKKKGKIYCCWNGDPVYVFNF